ncbi:MAG: hypothetical protein ACKKMO_02065 [Candidatus Nealsonbacteria bacterium]
MIELKPNLNKISPFYNCPNCKGKIVVEEFCIPGKMNLVKLECKSCYGEFMADLPTSFGVGYQTFIDEKKLEIAKTENARHAKEYLKAYINRNNEKIRIDHKIIENKENIILVNCLDSCYAHSLFKLLNSARYIRKFGRDFGICLMIPYQLQHLIPEGVSEILEFYLPFNRYKEWFNVIDEKIHKIVKRKSGCYLALSQASYNPESYDLSKFTLLNKKEPQDNKNYKLIVFLYREDQRIWGETHWHQKRNIEKLFKYLKKYYKNLRFVLIGLGKNKKFQKEIIDLREEKFDLSLEKKWIEEYKKADCLLGVHGSNMNLPSLLAKNMISLIPEYKYQHVFEDIRLNPNISCSENLYRYRILYGNYSLSDISPQKLFKVLVHQLELSDRNKFLANLNLEPKINNIEEWKKRREMFKSFPKDLKLEKYSFVGQLFKNFPFLKSLVKKIRKS